MRRRAAPALFWLQRPLDDNRQLLLAASFPQSVVALLHRYASIHADASRPLPLSLIELKILKIAAGVLLNTSLYFGSCPRSIRVACRG